MENEPETADQTLKFTSPPSKHNYKRIVALVSLLFLFIAIILVIVSIQNNQDIRQRASGRTDPIIQALEIKDTNENALQCDTSVDPPECTSSTQDVNIRVRDTSALSQ